jgi:hypothetical protein
MGGETRVDRTDRANDDGSERTGGQQWMREDGKAHERRPERLGNEKVSGRTWGNRAMTGR